MVRDTVIAVARLTVVLAGAGAQAAPFQDLTTNRDGSSLYFTSSLRLLGKGDPHAKVFRWRVGEGLDTYRQIPRLQRPGPAPNTNTYLLQSPSVSGDGKALAYLRLGERFGGLYGDVVYDSSTAIEVVSSVASPGLSVNLSRDGRCLAIRFGTASLAGSVHNGVGCLLTGSGFQEGIGAVGGEFDASRPLVGGSRQMVADNGWIVFFLAGSRQLWLQTSPTIEVPRAAQERIRLNNSEPAMAPAISANGRTVVYESLFQHGQQRRLFAIDTASGQETLLLTDGAAEGEETAGPETRQLLAQPYFEVPGPLFGASIDDEGKTVLALARDDGTVPQQWLVVLSPDGDPARWIAYAEEGFLEAVISGDGRKAFATTGCPSRLCSRPPSAHKIGLALRL